MGVLDRAKEYIKKNVEPIHNPLRNPIGELEEILTVIDGGERGNHFQSAIDTAETTAQREEDQANIYKDPEVEAAARAQRRRYGRAATMLTGGQGLMGEPTTARRTLLGA